MINYKMSCKTCDKKGCVSMSKTKYNNMLIEIKALKEKIEDMRKILWLKENDAILDKVLDEMVADGKITIDENGYYKVNDTDVFKP